MKQFNGFTKGVNLGGWLSQCDYEKSHLDSFITESDIENIVSHGADHVRLPFDFNIIIDERGNLLPDAFHYIDNCVEWCRYYGLNIILDLHKTVGFSFDKYEQETGFFDDVEYQNIFVCLWTRVAERYAAMSDFVAFELLNEITDRCYAEAWNSIAKRTIEAVREVAPSSYILVGGIFNNSIYGLTLLDKPYDDKVVFNFHYYNPMAFTHQKAHWLDNMKDEIDVAYPDSKQRYYDSTIRYLNEGLAAGIGNYHGDMIDKDFIEHEIKQAVETAEQNNAILYCGEYGVIDTAPCDEELHWMEDIHAVFEKYSIGRAVWTYKSKDFGITDESKSEITEKLFKLL